MAGLQGDVLLRDFFNRLQHLRGVAPDADAAPDPGDPASLIHEESRSYDTNVFAPEQRLLAPDAVIADRLSVLVRSQNLSKAVLRLEFVMFLGTVR
ncbi:MAG: hypothetical protein K0S21_1930 [Rhizobiaceae bacterium]|nr:hypothetical protein [Rhizobiaceae bacterium]